MTAMSIFKDITLPYDYAMNKEIFVENANDNGNIIKLHDCASRCINYILRGCK